MAAKLVFYFTGTDHCLYRWSAGTLALEEKFPADDLGLTAFREYLKAHRGALVRLVADLAGEDFHEDRIPYLRGSDRQAVIERRLAQRYRDTRLAAALPLGYVAEGRRNERLLLASFTNTQQFAPWLEALAEAGARLSGVYSVPLLAPAVAARLGTKSGYSIVVSADRAGLRQSFVENGRLRFARLEQTVELAPQALAALARAETVRLAQYLGTLRALPREGPPVQVVAIAPPGERAAFERALVSDERLAFHTVGLEEAARKCGLKRVPEGAAAECLYLALAARHPPREQFARQEDRRGFFLWRLQRGIAAAGAAGFAACVLYAGALWIDLHGVKDQISVQQREAREATQRHERITASFPVTQTSTDNLKATVLEFTRIAAQSASPEPALAYLSQVLDRFPQMEIEQVQWRAGKPEAAAGGLAADRRSPPASAQSGAPAAADMMQMLEVAGRVNALKRSDYRAITGEVQRFAQALRADPAWRILRTQLPFDVTPEGTLSGDIGSAEGAEAPRFSILIGRPLQ